MSHWIRRWRSPSVAFVSLLTAGATGAAEGAGPIAGRYRIEVSLEMPNVMGSMRFRTVERCLADGVQLEIVSNPVIAACPVAHRALESHRLEIEVICAPVNTGRARASYQLGETEFQGRIAVTMGAKNMTLTEVQRGTRIGECGVDQPTSDERAGASDRIRTGDIQDHNLAL